MTRSVSLCVISHEQLGGGLIVSVLMLRWKVFVLGVTLACLVLAPAMASDADDLAKKLANPVASLISVPFQANADMNLGPTDGGERVITNVQPVIPTSISKDWNLITRVIAPLVFLDGFPDTDTKVFGLGDLTPTFFFSPKAPTSGGLIWGVGPVFLLPTATDDLIGAEKWGIGPSGLVLRQKGPWTVGALVNHISSVAGHDDRADISQSYVQPFVTYNYPGGFSWAISSETSYDWKGDQWTIPVIAQLNQVTKWGKQPISMGLGFRYYAEAPENGPTWGIRAQLVFIFPKK